MPNRSLSLVAFTLFTFSGIGHAQGGPIVWVVPSLQRVGQSDPAGSGTLAQLAAAKGEYESFQVVVKGPASGLSNVNVSVTDLTSSSGQTISKSNLSLFREQYVYVNASSPNWGGSNQPLGAGWYPDGLIPFVDPATGLPPVGASLTAVPFSLSAGSNQPIWVDVFVPRSVAAGFYSGSYTVTSSQGSVTGQISLQVWNFTLPLKPSLKSSFSFWNADSLAAEQELLRNRVTPLNVPASNQTSLMSYGLGTNNVPYWSGANVSTCSMSAAPSVAQFQTAAANNQSGLYLYDYSADEVGSCSNLYSTIQQWAYNMHQAGVNNLVTMAPVSALFDDGSGTGRSAVDDWVILPVMYNGSAGMVQQALQKGDSVWSYNTLVQDSYSPKWEIDFAPINFRIQPGFINQSLGLSGLLYWKVDGWTSSPWTNVNNAGTYSSANFPGEAMLVYPGSTVGITGVAPSMRLKWIRDGVDDYDYITLLKQAGQGAFALQVAQSVGPDWTNWTRDPNAVASARQQLGQQLDALNGGSPNPPPAPVPAPSAPGSPSPVNSATGVSTSPTLSWSATSNTTAYDVYFGTSSSPSLVTTVSATSYQPAALAQSTTYFWRIVAKGSGGSTSSATWSFTTAAPIIQAPSAPSNPSPANGSSGVSNTPTLSWAASANATSYDVYFGGLSNPAYLTTVTGTSIQPGTLATSMTYYWRVVANGPGGSTSSAAWTFTTGAPAPPPPPTTGVPGSVSVTPSSGTGLAQNFTFVFSDSAGYQSLTGLHALINSSANGGNACWMYYDVAGNALWLSSDDTSTWSNTAMGSSTTIQNSRCQITGSGIRVSGSGNNFSLTVPVVFTTAFSGAKNVYLNALDKSGTWSSYVALGGWTIPASTSLGGIAATPSSGTGANQTFTFVFSDPNGYQSLSGVHVIVNSLISGTNGCWLYYDTPSNSLWLASDDVASWSNITPGSGVVSNSRCTINGSGTSVRGSGNYLTLTVPITFTSLFSGNRTVYLSATDKSGTISSYIPAGTWLVP